MFNFNIIISNFICSNLNKCDPDEPDPGADDEHHKAVHQLSQTLDVPRIAFNRFVGLPQNDGLPTPSQFQEALTTIESLQAGGAKVKLSGVVPQCFQATATTGCGAGKNFVAVDSWGKVRPCNHAPLILGDLRRESLAEIMANSRADYWRNLTPTDCYGCAKLAECGGGCRAEAMLNQLPTDSLMQRPFVAEDKIGGLMPQNVLREFA